MLLLVHRRSHSIHVNFATAVIVLSCCSSVIHIFVKCNNCRAFAFQNLRNNPPSLICPSLVAVARTNASASTNANATPHYLPSSSRPSSRVRVPVHLSFALVTTDTKDSHSHNRKRLGHNQNQNYLKVKNPATGRYINHTGESNKSSRWFQIMHKQGGYIKHRSELVPIQLEQIQSWQYECQSTSTSTSSACKSKSKNDKVKVNHKKSKKRNYNDVTTSSTRTPTPTSSASHQSHQHGNAHVHHPPYDPDCSWLQITPSISKFATRTTTTTNEIAAQHALPFLDQLLFATKPSNLLTLPGIGPEKSTCLASEVNRWLTSTTDGSEMLQKAIQSAKDHEHNNNNNDDHNDQQPPKKKKRKRAARDHNRKKKTFVPRPCHRLDLDTSGVMVIALTQDALRVTSALFESRLVQKSYVALVAGHMNLGGRSGEDEEGVVEYSIGKVHCPEKNINEFKCYIPSNSNGNGIDKATNTRNEQKKKNKVWTDHKDSFVEGSLRAAKTEYRISKRFTLDMPDGTKVKYTRVHLKPMTGRGHQLRLHMAAIGAPILGDTLHAPEDIARATPRLCLHAEKLEMDVMMLSGASSSSDGKTKTKAKKASLCASSLPPF